MSSWILLRGLTRGSGHWAGFADRLMARVPDARVMAIDLPGNGMRYLESSPTRIEAMTAQCRAQLRRLDMAPPFHLLAVSMGAMVALDWAMSAPDELDGCVLINSSVSTFSPWHWRLRPRAWPDVIGSAIVGSAERREAATLRITSRHAEAAAAVWRDWSRLRRAQPVSRLNALRQLLAAWRYRPPVHAPPVPLLVLSSARDALVDPRCSLALATRWHASTAVHPSAGHDLTLDDGPWVADQVALWLARL